MDAVFLEAKAHALARAGEQHGGAAFGDPCGGGGRGDVEAIDLAQGEKRAESIRKFVHASTHPRHQLVAVSQVIRGVCQHFQPVRGIHLPRPLRGEQAVHRIVARIILISGMDRLIGRRPLGFAKVIDDLEFYDTEKPGTEG